MGLVRLWKLSTPLDSRLISYTREPNRCNALLFLLTDVPIADTFQCLSNVWEHCIFGPVPSLGDVDESFSDFDGDNPTVTFAFLLFGGPGQCQSDGGAGEYAQAPSNRTPHLVSLKT